MSDKVAKEVLQLASIVNASFIHVNRNANGEADSLAKEGIRCPASLIIRNLPSC